MQEVGMFCDAQFDPPSSSNYAGLHSLLNLAVSCLIYYLATGGYYAYITLDAKSSCTKNVIVNGHVLRYMTMCDDNFENRSMIKEGFSPVS